MRGFNCLRHHYNINSTSCTVNSRTNNDNLRTFCEPERTYDKTADPADAIKLGAIKAVKLG